MDIAGAFSNIGENIKNFFNNFDFEKTLHNIGRSPAGSAIVSFAGGFALGFFFKRYFRTFILCFVASISFVVLLNHYQLIIIDFDATKTLLGFDPDEVTVTIVFISTWHLIIDNILIFVPGSLGFVLGYKLA